MAYTIKISHPIFHMDFSHDRTALFFSHYFFTCSFESVLISHTKKEVHMHVKLQFCVWNLFHTQNFTCLIYFTCISHAFHIYFTRLLLVVICITILFFSYHSLMFTCRMCHWCLWPGNCRCPCWSSSSCWSWWSCWYSCI